MTVHGLYAQSQHATCPGREVEPNPCVCCCDGCVDNCAAHDPDHGNCLQPSRWFWWSARQLSYRWKLLYLNGVHGGDEFCNRTLGLRLPGGVLFVVLNWRLRYETCSECMAEAEAGW